jgi:hypothetical protein
MQEWRKFKICSFSTVSLPVESFSWAASLGAHSETVEKVSFYDFFLVLFFFAKSQPFLIISVLDKPKPIHIVWQ